MGTPVGRIIYSNMQKLMLVACLAVAALAAPEADADAYYGGYGYGHQLAWPSTYGLGFQSTVYGARGYAHGYGKRSADAEPTAEADADAYYGYGGYGGYGHGYGGYGHGYGHGGYSHGYGHGYGRGYGHGYGYGYHG